MPTPKTVSEPVSESESELRDILTQQRRAFDAAPYPTWAQRKDSLKKLRAAVDAYKPAFKTAITEDFGHRSAVETELAEFSLIAGAIKYALKHGENWMRARNVPIAPAFWPARNTIVPQPLGVVGIISPWNYPLQLSLVPLIGALCAGNRVMLKPSELTPKTSAVLKDMIEATFKPNQISVILGGAQAAAQFTALPFDHLFFTGSTEIGRKVAVAAAKTLTPVTLELGGKSPAIIDDSADMAFAAQRIISGKLLNSGQTCIAPDYILMPEDKIEVFTDLLIKTAQQFYPTICDNPDYTSIISPRHFERLHALLKEAKSQGANVIRAGSEPPGACAAARKMPLHIVTDMPPGARVMTEEIFGPILPIVPAQTLDDALAFVAAQPRPLALYWFGKNTKKQARVLKQSHSGGVCINETLWHQVQKALPFGGIGPSGQGAYHGHHSFETFSHMKAVFTQTRFNQGKFINPPYTRLTDKLISMSKYLQ